MLVHTHRAQPELETWKEQLVEVADDELHNEDRSQHGSQFVHARGLFGTLAPHDSDLRAPATTSPTK